MTILKIDPLFITKFRKLQNLNYSDQEYSKQNACRNYASVKKQDSISFHKILRNRVKIRYNVEVIFIVRRSMYFISLLTTQ